MVGQVEATAVGAPRRDLKAQVTAPPWAIRLCRGIVAQTGAVAPDQPLHVTDTLSSPTPHASAQPMLAVYGHVVTWRHLILTAIVLVVGMAALAAAVAWWSWQNLAARVVLKEQQATVRLPASLDVEATLERQVRVQVDQVLPVRVPIQQDLSIPLAEPLPVQVSIDTVVPVNLSVPIRHVFKLDQVIDVDSTVQTRVLGIPLSLPVRGRVPVRADVPIDIVVPFKQDLPVALTTQARVRITEPLRTRIDTVIETRVPIRESLSLPIRDPVKAHLTFPRQRVEAGLELMDLNVPFESVSLVRRPLSQP